MKLILIVTFFLTIAFYSPQKIYQNINSAIDDSIMQKMNEAGIVGLGAAIIVDKKLVWAKGYGYADKDNKVLFTPNTIMNVASITKTITGACLMHAVEDKKLLLDEDINNYLPFKVVNPFFPKGKITLRNLATHTSGIIDQSPLYDSTYYYGGDSPVPLGEFLKNYFDPTGKYYKKENFLNVKPGSFYKYSNIAAGLAGYIVEIATGKKLNEYSKQYIFKPLNMNNTGWFLSEIKLTNHSKLYKKKGDTVQAIKLYGLTTYPDGGVRTSVSDLSKFFTCLLSGGELNGVGILKKESVQEMLADQFNAVNKPENFDIKEYNSGIFWATEQKGDKIGHSGSDPGVSTEMYYYLSKKIGVILFVNTDIDDANTKNYYAIYNELWKYASTIKEAKPASR